MSLKKDVPESVMSRLAGKCAPRQPSVVQEQLCFLVPVRGLGTESSAGHTHEPWTGTSGLATIGGIATEFV
ncbi:hypothetical protein J6590_080322 [Homalodisca vitripennis]|nr:hypothetical protein J6590_080322 [Homalodisca vitripennis]